MLDGRPSISRRYATDWFLTKDGVSFKGNERDRRSYYSYGQPRCSRLPAAPSW